MSRRIISASSLSSMFLFLPFLYVSLPSFLLQFFSSVSVMFLFLPFCLFLSFSSFLYVSLPTFLFYTLCSFPVLRFLMNYYTDPDPDSGSGNSQYRSKSGNSPYESKEKVLIIIVFPLNLSKKINFKLIFYIRFCEINYIYLCFSTFLLEKVQLEGLM